jgi:hypothetical protein
MYDWAELRYLRYLLAIPERQGFRVAAEQLRSLQPNLTVQARQFQGDTPVRLFPKMKNGRPGFDRVSSDKRSVCHAKQSFVGHQLSKGRFPCRAKIHWMSTY